MPQQEIDKLDMTSLLDHLLHSGVQVFTLPYSGTWGEIDSIADLNMLSCDQELLTELQKTCSI
jgi:hypothetical protein